VAVFNDERVITWGDVPEGQEEFLNLTTRSSYSLFKDLEEDETIIKADYSTSESVAILTSHNRFLVYGDDAIFKSDEGTNNYQDDFVDISNLFDLNSSETIVDFELGTLVSMALTSDQRLFIWGSNENGRISSADIDEYLVPVDVTLDYNLAIDERINTLLVGDHFVGVFTSEGRLLVRGQLYFDGEQPPYDLTTALPLSETEALRFASINNGFLVLVTSLNRVINIDTSSYISNHQDFYRTIVTFPLENQITDADSNLFVTTVLSETGDIYLYGDDDHYYFGTALAAADGPVNISESVDLLEGERFINVSMGYDFVGALTNMGNVYVMGQGVMSEFAIDSQDSIQIKLTKISQMLQPGPVIHNASYANSYEFGPTFQFDGSATLNGEAFTSGTTIDEKGEYVLLVTDEEGYTTTYHFHVEYSRQNPLYNYLAIGGGALVGLAALILIIKKVKRS
jgi:hypothetical protein